MELLGNNDTTQIRKGSRICVEDWRSSTATTRTSFVAVFGAGGELLASNRYFPLPEVSVAHREDFGAAQALACLVYSAANACQRLRAAGF
ncbi:hypothetical protein PQQ72_23600 [Paraburkholderia strydomiana]|uniref:hypothetical protein n=1 Tax=Paraburkholderia strydomiana TaxID=1245417 RepID=UPI0038BC5687